MSFEVKVEYVYKPQKVLWAIFPPEAEWSPSAQHFAINGCKIKNITHGPRTNPRKENLLSIFLKEKDDLEKFENDQTYRIERVS